MILILYYDCRPKDEILVGFWVQVKECGHHGNLLMDVCQHVSLSRVRVLIIDRMSQGSYAVAIPHIYDSMVRCDISLKVADDQTDWLTPCWGASIIYTYVSMHFLPFIIYVSYFSATMCASIYPSIHVFDCFCKLCQPWVMDPVIRLAKMHDTSARHHVYHTIHVPR